MKGKHVMVEKPLTLSSEEARDLIDIAKKRGLILAAGYLFRFNAAAIEVKRMLGGIGCVNYITARYIHSNKPPRKDCGVVFNFATHLVDILTFILEKKPRKIFCKKLNLLSEEREDVAFITLDYGSLIANLEVSWLHPLKRRDMWIIGSKGKIYADFLEQIVRYYPIEVRPGEVAAGKEVNVEVRKNEPLKEELGNFIKSIKAKAKYPYDEYLITRVCELCLESSEEGKEVVLE
jgi:predicted dehydrogenase